MTTIFEIVPERDGDEAAIDAIHELAFGPGRFARTAFRIRESAPREPALAFVALHQSEVVGSVRLTAVTIGATPALLLGPLAVHPAFAGKGAGRTLMRASLHAAQRAGNRLIVLVGDEAYYGPFGFRRIPPGRIIFPGPVDPDRVLVAELAPGAFASVAGPIMARREDPVSALPATTPRRWRRAAGQGR